MNNQSELDDICSCIKEQTSLNKDRNIQTLAINMHESYKRFFKVTEQTIKDLNEIKNFPEKVLETKTKRRKNYKKKNKASRDKKSSQNDLANLSEFSNEFDKVMQLGNESDEYPKF